MDKRSLKEHNNNENVNKPSQSKPKKKSNLSYYVVIAIIVTGLLVWLL